MNIFNSTFLASVVTMGSMGFIFSFLLAFADKKLHVEVDPKIEKIYELLPQLNCGVCGCAGCLDFVFQPV